MRVNGASFACDRRCFEIIKGFERFLISCVVMLGS